MTCASQARRPNGSVDVVSWCGSQPFCFPRASDLSAVLARNRGLDEKMIRGSFVNAMRPSGKASCQRIAGLSWMERVDGPAVAVFPILAPDRC
jgi:hypothetical protein